MGCVGWLLVLLGVPAALLLAIVLPSMVLGARHDRLMEAERRARRRRESDQGGSR